MFQSTKIIELGSCAFRQPRAKSHCRHLHGYRLIAKLWFNCKELDQNNWVMDFGALKDLKKQLEFTFDHTLVVAADDPQLPIFRQLATADAANLVVMDKGVGIERFAEFVFDASNDHVKKLTNGRVWVTKVEVWEHEKNSAIYETPVNVITPEIKVAEEISLKREEPEYIKLEAPVTAQPQHSPGDPYAAKFGNQVTKGWSNPFAGTSWGA